MISMKLGKLWHHQLLNFRNNENIDDINRCMNLGVSFTNRSISDELEGISFVITGSFNGISRSEIKKKLEMMGARVSSSISKNISFLVLGSSPGSKLNKAKDLNIPIIMEDQLGALLDGNLSL